MKIDEKDGKLVIVDFNDLEAFRIASTVEKEGMDFYKKLLNTIPEGESKEAISFLLKEETRHLKLFEEWMFGLSKDDLFEEDNLLASFDYGIFRPYKDIKELKNALETPETALRLGIVIEDKSIKFYEACKNSISNSDTKKALSGIINEEYKHKEILESMLNKI